MKFTGSTFQKWLLICFAAVIILFGFYTWLITPNEIEETGEEAALLSGEGPATESGGLVFSPQFQEIEANPGDNSVVVFFTVENTTGEGIKVASIRSGCTCLDVTIDKDPIPAGEKAIITGEFDISELRGRSIKSISVKPDRKSRPVVLSTSIQIEEIYTLTESLTTWKVGDKPETKRVEFRVLRDEPIRILSAESQREEVTCEIEVIEEGRAYDLKLTPNSTDGSLLGIVRIESDCELENYARPLAYYAIQR
jgi:hypothetical protein